jgi:hypothetical protein
MSLRDKESQRWLTALDATQSVIPEEEVPKLIDEDQRLDDEYQRLIDEDQRLDDEY